MEAVYRDYAPQGVRFFYIYKTLAHPETNGYATPFTLEERLLHIAEAERTLGSGITWLCDTMTNDVKHALGDAPNSEFIIDPQGRVARRRAWSDPRKLRNDLEELVGPVDQPTLPDEIQLGRVRARPAAETGVVQRVRVTSSMRALRIRPRPSTEPHFAKLRAEVSAEFLRRGKGQLYLGFHLDPLYHVHWNNLQEPLQYRIRVPKGIRLSATSGRGPQPEPVSDSDPREFLLEIERRGEEYDDSLPLRLTVDYFACNSQEGWCKAVSQSYDILLEEDPDGGWVGKRFRAGASRGKRPPASR